MIYIEDYQNLPARYIRQQKARFTELLGQRVSVRTSAGTYTGVVVLEDAYALTLAYTRFVRGRRQNRRLIIAKYHIVAIETVLR